MNTENIRKRLRINCEKCCGLCCVAFYCAKSDGFPQDKLAGVPCVNLDDNFKCIKHETLVSDKRKGCISFDCCGAGQKTSQIFEDQTWKNHKIDSNEIYQTFYKVMRLHQVIWYLLEVYDKTEVQQLRDRVLQLLNTYENIDFDEKDNFNNFDVESYQSSANVVLKEFTREYFQKNKTHFSKKKDYVGKDMREIATAGMDFTMAYLMATNFEKCNLRDINFLGADIRDANFKGSNLSESLFLTQMQINSCIGDSTTKLPRYLQFPKHWNR